MITIIHQSKNTNKEINTVLKKRNGNSGVQKTVTKMRNSLEGLNSRFELGGRKNMSELKDRSVEIMKFEKQ